MPKLTCDESITQKESFLSKTLLKDFSGDAWSRLSDAERAALTLNAGAEAGARLAKFKREVEELGAGVEDVDKRSHNVVPLRQRRQKVRRVNTRGKPDTFTHLERCGVPSVLFRPHFAYESVNS